MHSQLPERIEDHQNLESKRLSPGLAFLIGAVARMAQEVRPPFWPDPPPSAPPDKPQATLRTAAIARRAKEERP
jgi:hypothetical protein